LAADAGATIKLVNTVKASSNANAFFNVLIVIPLYSLIIEIQ